jgi:penicillin amidase
VYADVDGQTGWVAAAATPVRRQGHGLLPVSGQPAAAGWERYLTIAEWPQSFNPISGWLATANHNILPAGYPHHIALDWSAPYRFQRIESRLTQRTPLTLKEFQSIQHDSGSIPGEVLQSIIRTVTFPEPLRPWVTLFLDWGLSAHTRVPDRPAVCGMDAGTDSGHVRTSRAHA